MPRHHVSRAALVVLSLALLSCGDSGPTEPKVGPPAALVALSGGGQSGEAGGALASPLVVQVKDANGRAVSGASVAWNAAAGSVAPATSTTDASGQAKATWTLDARLGEQTATAAVAGLAPASFTATATLPSSTSVLKSAGDAQTDTVAQVLGDSLVLQVRTPSGPALAGVPVVWSVVEGGGSVSGTTTTDAQGRARAAWTLGTAAGTHRVQARVAELQPVVFSATATPDRPASVQITPDSTVLRTWGDTARLSAAVKDQFGNVVPGATLTWSSSDTTLASVSATGLVASYPAGRAGTSMITATSYGVQASSKAVVKLQFNAMCRPSTSFPVKQAVGGLPSFAVQDSLDTPGLAYSRHDVVSFDHDRDGDEDIIVLSYEMPPNEPYGGALLVWNNNGAGRFGDATQQALGGTPIVVDNSSNHTVVADFNGDGMLDMFVALGGYDAGSFPGAKNLLVLAGAGGTFREVGASNLSPNEAAFTHSAAGADVDCDGDVDLYEGNIVGRLPHLLINAGGAVFQPEDSRLPSDIIQQDKQYLSAEFCDVDRDGDRDFLLGAWQQLGGSDRLLINDGFGQFRDAPPGTLPASYFQSENITISVKCTDFDRDGWDDLILSTTNEYKSPHIAFWRNRQDGRFEDRTAELMPQAWQGTSWYFRTLSIADMNGDGWPDIVSGGPSLDNPQQWGSVFINQGAAGFVDIGSSIPDVARDQYESYCDYHLTPVQADGDGRTDLLITRSWYQCNNSLRPKATILRNGS